MRTLTLKPTISVGLAPLALLAVLAPVALASDASGTHESHKLSLMATFGLLLLGGGFVALLVLVENESWSKKYRRLLGVGVAVGLISGLVDMNYHHDFVVLPMLGTLLIAGGLYALYRSYAKFPVFEYWPTRADLPDETDDEQRVRYAQEQDEFREKRNQLLLQHVPPIVLGLIGGTVLLMAAHFHVTLT